MDIAHRLPERPAQRAVDGYRPLRRDEVLARTLMALVLIAAAPALPSAARSAPIDLVGLWEARRYFGPEVRGTLVISAVGLPQQAHPRAWRAAIAGRTAQVHLTEDSMTFDLPDRSGAFIGRFDEKAARLSGHWIQPPTWLRGGEVASPLWFRKCGENCFEADVVPLDDEYTFYLEVTRRPDGTLGAVLRNPERNLGRRIGPDRLERDGDKVRWLDARGKTIHEAVLRDSVMTVFIGGRGGSYDFRRVPEGVYSYFYARGIPNAAYGYQPPRQRDDGWPVGTLEEVGMSREKISDLIGQLIDAPRDSIGALKVHGILIARHGKLVLEEYFYGQHAEKPHDTRSASKTLTSILVGAAARTGVRIGPDHPVYTTMRPGRAEPDSRKRALRLDHLLTMSSGFDCDDNDETSPGNEEVIFSEGNPTDWEETVLKLGMKREPGAEFVYCSAGVQLAGGMLSRVTGRSRLDLMQELIAEPLGIRHYYAGLTPTRDAVMGGGWYFRLRDFMKLGQLYLNGGTWGGKRIVDADWVKRSSTVRYSYGRRLQYGYLWWIIDYPLGDRTVQAYFASGLGGQAVMVFPDLDLVVAFFGGNYGDDDANWAMVVDLIPRYVLAAITQ